MDCGCGKAALPCVPRIAAYAETGWSRKEDKDFQDFQRRLPGYEKILDALKIKHGEEK